MFLVAVITPSAIPETVSVTSACSETYIGTWVSGIEQRRSFGQPATVSSDDRACVQTFLARSSTWEVSTFTPGPMVELTEIERT